jgi:HlyD family secretion protein
VSITISGRPIPSDWKRPARFGYAVIILTFAVGGGWAATAQLGSAVVAPAVVAIETNIKVVQHLEGGIIGETLVRENQHVDQGQVVLRLSDVQARASLATVTNQLMAARVQEARLIAERDQRLSITLPADIEAKKDDPVVANAMADQTAAFNDRQQSLHGQIGILGSRIKGLNNQIDGLVIQEKSTKEQLVYIEQELVGLRQLLAAQLVPLARVLALERERARLEGVIGQSVAEEAKAQNQIGETKLNIQELLDKFQEEAAAGIVEVRQKIADLREKMASTTDIMHRQDIRAPVSGAVQDLKVYTVGQVIRPGESLMEIVPDESKLVVNARFATTDIDRVHRARQVEVRFPSFHARTTPVILGELASVSEDRLTDEATHQEYYLGVIAVDKLQIPEELRDRLRPGMPAEIIAPIGERTVFSYLISPLMESWHHSMREE